MDNSKLLIIIPSFFFIESYHKNLFYKKIPLKVLQLSSFLREKKAIKSHFIDLRFERSLQNSIQNKNLNKKEFQTKFLKVLEKNSIQEFQNICIILDSSFEFVQTEMIAEIIKKNLGNTNLIVGGYHPTAVPNDFLYKSAPYDYIVVGELEKNFLNLFHSIEKKKISKDKTPRLIGSEDCIDLDLLPFPDYHLYLTKYSFKDWFKFEINLSRGCPFNCRFCRIIKLPIVRNYSFTNFLENFKKLMDIVMNYNKTNTKISFLDHTFNSASISKRTLNYIIQNRLNESFRFSCQTRIEYPYKYRELIGLFKKSKMVVGYGFETANKNLLLEMKKTKNPTNYIRKMKEILKEYKNFSAPYCRINIIIGYPGEDRNSFEETIAFLKENAFHENIQISPTLFINDPITYVYHNMQYYEKKYGSEFEKEWWKYHSDPLKNAIIPRPSRNYTRKELIRDYVNKYSKILTKFKHNSFNLLINWKQYYNKWLKEI
ncbi:MAG: B12-binding domain-containing radical SAM protein [Promethearchaeota archaeon]